MDELKSLWNFYYAFVFIQVWRLKFLSLVDIVFILFFLDSPLSIGVKLINLWTETFDYYFLCLNIT